MHYIYVIQTREFITQKLPVYKIGKTEQELTSSGRNKRMNGYPKDSIQLALFAVSNCHEAEKLLIKNLNLSDDIKVIGIGNEWFEGPMDTICQIALSSALAFKPIHLEEVKVVDLTSTKIVCKFCNKHFTRKDNRKTHEGSCKDRYDIVRTMEIQLGIEYPTCISKNKCRFCHHESKTIYLVPKHIKKCKAKQEYKELLEAQVAKQ